MYNISEAVNSELVKSDLNTLMSEIKRMNKSQLETNFDLNVAKLEIFRDDNKALELICNVLDAIAHELYTRVNHKLH